MKPHPFPAPRLSRAPQRSLRAGALGALVVLAGCAAQLEHRAGLGLLADGKTAEGVESLRRASEMEPNNVSYRSDFLSRREAAEERLLAQAESERAAGHVEAASESLLSVLRLHPGSERALSGLQALDADRRADTALQSVQRLLQANQVDAAKDQLQRVLRDSPRHPRALELQHALDERLEAQQQAREEELASHAAFKRPVTLQFRDAPLKMVFEALAKVGNVNLIIDREVKGDQRTTIFVKDASIEDSLDVILLQNQLEKRQLNSNTLLIYPSTANRIKELAELKVRSFQISNIDVGFMANILKTMLKAKDVVTDPKSNTLVMRDTPEAISLAERLVAANDLPDAEVMLEVEVLEVSSSHLSDIGLKLPTSVTLSVPDLSSGGTGLTLGGIRSLSRNDLRISPLQATLNLMVQDGDANVLARPRIRSRNREKARILVGDKLPIITNLISPQQAGQNSVVTGSIQYVEVGIKLEVEPQVYVDGDVGIKLNLEVSNVTDTVQTDSGRAYQIGTRSAQSNLRLHDGETQVMGGLISDADRNSAAKLPVLGQLPVLGRLFSDHSADRRKTEIVLAITPHIVRPQALPDPRDASLWSGTDGSLRDHALRIQPLSKLRAATNPGTGMGTSPPSPRPEPAAPPAPAPAAGVVSTASQQPPAVGSAPGPAPVQHSPVTPRFASRPGAAPGPEAGVAGGDARP